MNILTPELESTMYSTVKQAQLTIGTSMQRGLKIPITLTQCLEPQPWNKLEIPESLNGEGIAITIMDSQGGFLLFIPDDGILLPAGYASTLSDPTEPLPIMAGELQRKLLPEIPEYVGKRIGRAKVFSSMARRAGIDDSAMILPVKLIIGEQESHVWFVGNVPHPERAFAKRNPDSETRSKKSKLFSDEILSNYSAQSDFLPIFLDSQSNPKSETTAIIEESETDITLHGEKTNRQKADLNRLLALKRNYGNVITTDNSKLTKLSEPTAPEIKTFRVDKPHESIEKKELSKKVSTQQITESEQANIPEKTVPVDVRISTEPKTQTVKESQSVEGTPTIEENVHIEETVQTEENTSFEETIENIVVAETLKEETIPEQSVSINDDIIETSLDVVSSEENIQAIPDEISNKPEIVSDIIVEQVEQPIESTEEVVEQSPIVETIPEPIQQTVSDKVESVSVQTCQDIQPPIPVNPVFSAMTVPVEAVISQRRISLNEIIRWKPGCVIEFGGIDSSVNLVTKDIVLAHGQPVEYKFHIGLQLE